MHKIIRKFIPIALGLLVFFISFYSLNESPSMESRDSSTSNESSTLKVDDKPELSIPNVQNRPKSTKQQAEFSGVVPQRITIPSIEIDAPIQSLGYTSEGGMAVPGNLTDVGWFQPGTKPGNQGNAVLAGHVDGNSGPAVFYDLKKLNPGDVIHVYGKEEKLTFQVKHKESYPFEEAPLHKIFGPANVQALNLITCTGPYNERASTYSERLAVFSVLVERESLSE